MRVPGADQEFAAWIEPHIAVLTALAHRLTDGADVDDVVQEALVRAWRRRTTFDAERGTVRGWLAAILVDQSRRHRTRRRLTPVAPIVEQPPSPTRRMDVEQAVRRLPRRQREVVTLHYLADLPVAEVAEVLGISVGSVKSHLFDTRAALRADLGDV